MILSIDPAVKAISWAAWVNKELVACGHQPVADYNEAACHVRENIPGADGVVVIEMPQVYQGHKNTKGAAPEDIVGLAVMVGACAGATPHRVALVTPNRWKGQVPKDIMWSRCVKRLSVQELAVYEAATRSVRPGLRHNVHDAIGLGLYYLGRLAT